MICRCDRAELLNRGIYKTVSTILTQVVVDPYDEAFYKPSKIIGRVMTEEEAETEEKKGNHVTKVADGYRRIVAAPKPVDIVEIAKRGGGCRGSSYCSSWTDTAAVLFRDSRLGDHCQG